VVATAVVIVLSEVAPPTLLAAWFGYLLLTQIMRVLLWAVHRRLIVAPWIRPDRPMPAAWLTASSAAGGVAWGLAGFLFGTTGSSGILFVPFALAGMAAGAITVLPGHAASFFIFVWATLLPYALRLGTQPDPTLQAMAVVTLLYGTGISIVGWQAHRNLRRAAELHLRNEALVRRLQRARRNLEATVERRTHELQEANAALSAEIVERRRYQAQRELLLRELSHRGKNMLAVVLAIARQTGEEAQSTDEFMDRFEGRVHALAAAYELLNAAGWQGASLAALAHQALLPHLGEEDSARLQLAVEDLPVRADAAQNLVLVLHELATNALKHGALSVPEGRVELSGRLVPRAEGGRVLELVWREQDGPSVEPPTRHGFGTTLLSRAVRRQHHGSVDLDWRPEGLVCRMTLPEDEIRQPEP
jgi:two-component sensor histidine kinase